MHIFAYGALGGSLIGLSASILLLGAGHVLGASGIVSTAAMRDQASQWKLVFLASFIVTSYAIFQPIYDNTDQTLSSLSPAAFGIGGLLVGFGTKLGNGCTSGHGICGLARFSRRSFVSVCTFMLVGIITAVLTQASTSPLAFTSFLQESPDAQIPIYDTLGRAIVMIITLATFLAPAFYRYDATSVGKCAPAAIAGSLFASGLFISRMVYPSAVMGFLNVALIPKGDWDPTLAFVMGSGLIVSFASYQCIGSTRVLQLSHKPMSCPFMTDEEFSMPSNTVIDGDLVVGAVCFGLGWGISGLCPGPALFLASIGVSWVAFIYWPAFFFGGLLAVQYKSIMSGKHSDPCVKQPKATPAAVVDETTAPPSYGSLSKDSPELDV